MTGDAPDDPAPAPSPSGARAPQEVFLPSWLAAPRPNGSPSLRATAALLGEWLVAHGVPCAFQPYQARPFFNEALGVWLMAAPLALLAAVLAGWGLAAFVVGLVLVVVGVAEVMLDRPVVSRVGSARQENIIVHLPPPEGEGAAARREVVLSAHYDSKTEALDHQKRRVFTGALAPAMALCLVVGLGAWAADALGYLSPTATAWPRFVLLGGAGAVLIFGWGMGMNLATGRLLPRQSTGAVDNGGACAVLMELARRLTSGELRLANTAVTVAFLSGEEVTMQGSRAYVRSRDWPLPALAVNLECLGQDGPYCTWAADGTVLRRIPTDERLTGSLRAAAAAESGLPAGSLPFSSTDAYAFLVAGIPAAGLCTLDRQLGAAGLHGPLDAPGRVDARRLAEAERVLERLLLDIDR